MRRRPTGWVSDEENIPTRNLKCPLCGATGTTRPQVIITNIDGSYTCLQCGTKFTIGKGIKAYYPKIPIAKRVKAYIVLLRPLTLLPALLAGIIGTSLPLFLIHGDILSEWRTLIYVGVTLMLLQAVGQITNQVSDVEIDRINKPYRPIVQGLITKEEAMGFAWILAFIAIMRAITVGIIFGIFSVIFLFFAVCYNLPPRIKRYTWLGNLWLGVSRGYLPFVASWSVFGSLSDLHPHLIGMFALLWVFAFNATKDFPDVEGDKKFAIPTLPVRYGYQGAKRIMMSLGVFLPIYLAYAHLFLPNILFLLPVCFLQPLIYWGIGKSLDWTENTLAWVTFYAGLCLIYLLAIPVCYVRP